ncbi:hypothetical protein [Streptomyces pactum]|uniref:Uncharacterized protein n=1 Tax=Streptomyces pactum TaxID=68249 RepID=A0A1S6JD16_9ACTN|nr:hypothetical protein [Streptomyces pactum]AQS69656.1 hypothetical protein B1H29_24665 [Streptomyces pactum]
MTSNSASPLEDQVSPKTAQSLRLAMERLFAGRPERTDGRLTKENLWREAQVSRATMNRAHRILTDWDAHIAEHGKTTPGEARRDETITDLRKRLTAKTKECTRLERQLKAAAIAIAALHHDNEALRDELTERPATVVVGIGAQRRKPRE